MVSKTQSLKPHLLATISKYSALNCTDTHVMTHKFPHDPALGSLSILSWNWPRKKKKKKRNKILLLNEKSNILT